MIQKLHKETVSQGSFDILLFSNNEPLVEQFLQDNDESYKNSLIKKCNIQLPSCKFLSLCGQRVRTTTSYHSYVMGERFAFDPSQQALINYP